ncbi:hypothetical protein LguiA_016395 [Lonicera macranthoides]
MKNIEERVKEDVKKKEYEKQALKRAKLAKVQEHNEVVYRDASMASTSRSSAIGENLETGDEKRSTVKNKRQTLASMLKKKVTIKDGLAQRLLNTHAKDATTRQLTSGEDEFVDYVFHIDSLVR